MKADRKMNVKDLELMDSITEVIRGSPRCVILFDVRSTQFVRTSLTILKALLDEIGLGGVFISVDRPHLYMVHLMKMHQIPKDRVTFIDAISRFSADMRKVDANVDYVDGPFHINTLTPAIKEWTDCADNDSCGFAMIDNISSLLSFNSFNSVEDFLNDFVRALTVSEDMFTVLMVDRENDSLLYETARMLSDIEIKVNPDMKIESVSDVNLRRQPGDELK